MLSEIDVSKATGPDQLSPRILKELSNEITPILTFIFNQSLLQSVLPDDWLVSNIFALHKKGPKDLPDNYRPISLTSICSTLFIPVYVDFLNQVVSYLRDSMALDPGTPVKPS